MKFQKPKGTMDILPQEAEKWQFVENKAREIFKLYHFGELRTPIFENFEVIVRSIGENTDIVSKEMYDFYDKGNRHITLRPEGTAALVRSYVENKLFGPEHPQPFKAFYIGPMFRYERPQAGRLRQFHQIGVEVIGSQSPITDVETIVMGLDFFKELGITHLKLVINSLGNKKSRSNYREVLVDYLSKVEDQLSQDSKRRLYTNPLRVLDSKAEEDAKIIENAPSILDYLDDESRTFFEEVKRLLDSLAVPYEVDSRMVRGLDYYNDTVFEIMSDAPGFENVLTTICAGGRYDGLISEFDGPLEKDSGFGFALGIERVLIAIEAEGKEIPKTSSLDVYVSCVSKKSEQLAIKVAQYARHSGLKTELETSYRKLKTQLRAANRLGAGFVAFVGDEEETANSVTIKNLATGEETQVPLEELEQYFKEIKEISTR
ncbi:histidine--tRNA ligase [Vagococcus elongatus]|uniref:Histidine--tRNA ligase n=1 Tax=Vagococcus elongatus TaxID=180344 RepID=A0A430ALX3_9ENTE|nr:histidine--tRNA ligase [Vagococcus elongatus]RSU08933.1 histidine--tRNA ligase [Vagococcus elongatus]